MSWRSFATAERNENVLLEEAMIYRISILANGRNHCAVVLTPCKNNRDANHLRKETESKPSINDAAHVHIVLSDCFGTQNLLANMPNNFTTNSWLFPPKTDEIQFDEKWDFVRKKQKNCVEKNPDDARCGDNWDYVALDAENRLVLAVVHGKRTVKNTKRLVQNTAKRLKFKPPRLITSDEYKPYKQAILESFGKQRVPRPTGKRGRPKKPRYRPAKTLVYATVHKTRVKGRVVKIDDRRVFGTEGQVQAALKQSRWSRKINTAFVERHNAHIHTAHVLLQIINTIRRCLAEFLVDKILNLYQFRLALAQETPEQYGIPVTHWMLDHLVAASIKQGILGKISRASVHRILKKTTCRPTEVATG